MESRTTTSSERLMPWGVLAVLLGLVLMVGWRPISEIVRIGWTDDNSSYVLAVPLLAGVLAWVRRQDIALAAGMPRWRGVGLGLMVLGLGMYVGSYWMGFDSFWYASPVVMGLGAVALAFGGGVLWAALPAAVLMLFVVPMPAVADHHISQPMQKVASITTTELLNLFGVPVVRDGNLLSINGESVNVAEACSGMRSVFALSVLIYTMVFIRRYRWFVRVLLVVAAPLIAMVCNLFRVVPVTLAYGHGDKGLADALHDWLGFVAFGVAIVMCLGIVSVLQWARVRVVVARVVAPKRAGVEPRSVGGLGFGGGGWAAVAVSVAMLVGMGGVIYSPTESREAAAYHERVRLAVDGLPMAFGPWQGTYVPLTAPAEEELKPNAVYSVEFRDKATGKAFKASLIHCAYARDMGMHSPPVCYPNSGWHLGGSEGRSWSAERGDVSGTKYVFRRMVQGRMVQLHVANFYVMPSGGFSVENEAIRERAKLPWLDRFGVAQVQLVFDMRFSEQERERIVESFLEQSWDAFEVIQSGILS
ncbi:MAG: exosortase/archaeosortase family protein [Planctomycetota bacterium]